MSEVEKTGEWFTPCSTRIETKGKKTGEKWDIGWRQKIVDRHLFFTASETQRQLPALRCYSNENDWQRFIQCHEPIDHSSKEGQEKTGDGFSRSRDSFTAGRIDADPRKDGRIVRTVKIGCVSANGPVCPWNSWKYPNIFWNHPNYIEMRRSKVYPGYCLSN